jgi:PhzF family phenazine biosynthesis protein
MGIRIVQVDAFTDRPYTGNPAAVCILDAIPEDAWMQAIAGEMNLAETAFLVPEDGAFRLRWFTPLVEVDLCGHATLASAHVLWEDGHLQRGSAARFLTRSGTLRAECRGDWIEMDFPATRPEPVEVSDDVLAAIGTRPVWSGRSRFDLMLELDSETYVRELEPNLHAVQRLPYRGVIVTGLATGIEGVDFVSRFFAPSVGVPEDPVTGSAHCALAPYWAQKLGKCELVGYQASARGGLVRVRPDGDRVMLAGKAVTTLRAELV